MAGHDMYFYTLPMLGEVQGERIPYTSAPTHNTKAIDLILPLY